MRPRRFEAIEVTSHAGSRADEEPRGIVAEGVALDVDEVLERWAEPDARYFRVRTGDGRSWLLRCNRNGTWSRGVPEEPA